jgi:hypothetical protein
MTIPGMSVAGRGFTSYVSNSQMNNLLKTNNNVQDNAEYKEYIQKNAEHMTRLLYDKSRKLIKEEQWWGK